MFGSFLFNPYTKSFYFWNMDSSNFSQVLNDLKQKLLDIHESIPREYFHYYKFGIDEIINHILCGNYDMAIEIAKGVQTRIYSYSNVFFDPELDIRFQVGCFCEAWRAMDKQIEQGL